MTPEQLARVRELLTEMTSNATFARLCLVGEEQTFDEEMSAQTTDIAALAAMLARLEELEKDAARLDWLERVGFSTTHQAGEDGRDYGVHSWLHGNPSHRWRWTARYISSEIPTARLAIDAAMAREAAQANDGA